MIAIIDYGIGNLFSVCSSFDRIGADHIVTSDPDLIASSDKILLPGVGAFLDAKTKLEQTGLAKVVKEEVLSGKPILGICLGMQLLFEKSYEYGEHEGLGLLRGSVIGMKGRLPSELKIPHIGWNRLAVKKKHPLFKYVNEGDYVYFVHSFYAAGCDDSLLATTDYGIDDMTAAVAKGNIMGTQFHPEKSGDIGLSILRAFVEI